MPLEVLLPLPLLGLLAFCGLYMLTYPSAAIQKVSTWIRQLHEIEAELAQEPGVEPDPIEATHRMQLAVRVFGIAFVCASVFRAAMQLNAL